MQESRPRDQSFHLIIMRRTVSQLNFFRLLLESPTEHRELNKYVLLNKYIILKVHLQEEAGRVEDVRDLYSSHSLILPVTP